MYTTCMRGVHNAYKEASDLFELELWMVISDPVGAGSWLWVWREQQGLLTIKSSLQNIYFFLKKKINKYIFIKNLNSKEVH